MKVEITTIHYGVNYGSALQTYALFHTLCGQGYDVEVFNYIPNKYNTWESFTADKKGKYPMPVIAAGYLAKLPLTLLRRKKFSDFLRNRTNLSRRFRETDDLQHTAPEADAYIVGSDQVWNFDYNGTDSEVYFLSFLSSSCRRIAYAASIGKETLTEEEAYQLKVNLEKFFRISVREDTAKQLLEQTGISAEHVLDPTFLLKKEEWCGLVPEKFLQKEKFILVYVMDFRYENLICYADEVKKKTGLKVYVLSFGRIKDPRADRQFTFAAPEEFLGLVRDASFVITNSFHGVAFSVNFNKQFIAVGKEKYNSRIQSLLRIVNLENRFLNPGDPLSPSQIEEQIDYTSRNKILDQWRDGSLTFLKNSLAEQ